MSDDVTLPVALFCKALARHCRSDICFEIAFPLRGLDPFRLGYTHAIEATCSKVKFSVNEDCCALSRLKSTLATSDR